MSGWKRAFEISDEEIKQATPPGTVILVEHTGKHDAEAPTTTRELRVPQPSDDPSDPLNWPLWRKAGVLAIACLYAFAANFTSASIAPVLQLWPFVFPGDQRTFAELTYLVAANLLMLGAANVWWVPLSGILGRRPVLLAATLLLALCTVWGGLATSYGSLMAARVLQGAGGAAADTVAPALVGDVFFMHERGRAMAVYTVFLVLGPLVGGVSGGYIGFQLGWAHVFWVGAGISAAVFLGAALLVPETLFDREASLRGALPHAPMTSARALGFGRVRGRWLHHFVQPWRTLAFPGTWVVMLHYAGLVGGIVTVSTIGPQLLAMPPYLWGANVGLLNIGALIGALLGAAYTYFVSDARLRGQARHRQDGYAEPEDRLPTMFPALFIATVGFWVFGFSAQHPGENRWVGLQFGYGMIAFGLMQVPSIGFNYLIDAYTYLAADCFVAVTILRAVIAFAWTFFVANWVQDRGAAEPFGIFGMLMGLFSLLTVPLWLYGKRLRIATAPLLNEI